MKKFYKSKLSHIKDIKERNNVFNNELNDEDKRKEIAWDSLQLLLVGSIAANKCGYWDSDWYNNGVFSMGAEDLQNYMLNLKPQQNCEVCARGAMMLSQVRLGNEISKDISNNIDMGDEKVLKGFNMRAFSAMEDIYERNYSGFPHTKRTKEMLANICCNVITNGDFDTGDTTDYLKLYNIKLK